MCYGGDSDVKVHQEKIGKIATPTSDPVEGKDGPLSEHWKR